MLVVASHQVGRLLIDEEGDEGQLDYVYDELCDIGGRIYFCNKPCVTVKFHTQFILIISIAIKCGCCKTCLVLFWP